MKISVELNNEILNTFHDWNIASRSWKKKHCHSLETKHIYIVLSIINFLRLSLRDIRVQRRLTFLLKKRKVFFMKYYKDTFHFGTI